MLKDFSGFQGYRHFSKTKQNLHYLLFDISKAQPVGPIFSVNCSALVLLVNIGFFLGTSLRVSNK